jgi:transposase InsO family protein
MIFYYTVAKQDTYATARYFSVAPKTVYKWVDRFEQSKHNVRSLIEQSRKPDTVRTWTVTNVEEMRVLALRRKHMHWGKHKLKKLYWNEHSEIISTWKIERVIRKHGLYPNQEQHDDLVTKRARARVKPKLKITQFAYVKKLWHLVHLDGITIYWQGLKRYIFTVVDHTGKVGYARMYATKSSRSAKDFLIRLHYLIHDHIPNAQTDNGSEFYGLFDEALTAMETLHWYSRPRTPTDNAEVERFNQTLQYEWLNDGHFTPDCNRFNQALTEWLIEYNVVRPHESLNYLTPIEFMEQCLLQSREPTTRELLPMYPASTDY